MSDKIVVGLDVGSICTKSVVCKVDAQDHVEVLGVSSVPSQGISYGKVINLSKVEDTINNALARASESSNIYIKVVNVAIFGKYVEYHKCKGDIKVGNYNGEITQQDVIRLDSDIFNIAVQPGNKILSVTPCLYCVDDNHEVVDPVGMISKRLSGTYVVATIPISIYNSVIKCVERCNVEVDKIFSTPLAASNVLFTQTEMDTGVCGIDIGGDMTTLVIFKNNVLQHICSVPFGGQVITKDIKTAFDLTHKQAEKIKIEYGNPCLNDNASEEYVSFEDYVTHQTRNICLRSLSTVIRSRLTEILNILHEQILLKYEHDEVSTPAGIVLFGGSSKMKGLVEFVKNVTKQYVRTGYITENSNTSQLPIDYVQSYGIVLDEIVKKNYCKNTNNVRSSTGYNSFFKYVFSKTKKMLTGI